MIQRASEDGVELHDAFCELHRLRGGHSIECGLCGHRALAFRLIGFAAEALLDGREHGQQFSGDGGGADVLQLLDVGRQQPLFDSVFACGEQMDCFIDEDERAGAAAHGFDGIGVSRVAV